MDLLPWEALIEVAKHCEDGAAKYGERNCEKGIPIHSLIDSGMRHLAKYMMGMDDEPNTRKCRIFLPGPYALPLTTARLI